jgi:hypothetical protein
LNKAYQRQTEKLRNLENKKSIGLPDDFVFRQNETRCDDLEVEERALMNLASQELDQLRMIQSLPKDSDIY